jgi:hypothetical protein
MVIDPRQFVRQWNREIEAETPPPAAQEGGWRWLLLAVAELLWCALLIALVVGLKRLAW